MLYCYALSVGICVMVAHRTLTPFVGVRIPHSQPTKRTPIGVLFSLAGFSQGFEAAKKGSGGAFLSGDRRIFQSITNLRDPKCFKKFKKNPSFPAKKSKPIEMYS